MGPAQLHRVRFQSLRCQRPPGLCSRAKLARAFFAFSLPASVFAQPHHPNYDDDIRPIFARRCFGCHNASEMRSGLNLESYAGILKGGGSGDAVIAGRPSSSLLYKAVAREEGAPQMPLGGAKLPDAEIAAIREWIAGGLLENAASQPKGPVAPALDYHPTGLNRPSGAPAMPQELPAVELPEPARANPVTALAASPWAPLAAVAGHDRVYLYDLARRAPAGVLLFPEGIPYVLRFSRTGDVLLAAGGRGVQSGRAVLFDVRTGKRLATIGDERDIVLAADLSANGKLLALGGPGKIVKVYSVAESKELYQIKKHTDWITALEFSPDGERLATGDRSGGIFLWESANGANAGNFAEHKDSITSLSWRGDSRLLASASEDGQIIVWNAADGFPVASIAKAHTPKPAPQTYGIPPAGVLAVEFAANGSIYSVGRDSTIRVWSADGKPKAASKPFDCLLTRLAESFDGKLSIAGDYRGRIWIWDGTNVSLAVP